MTEIVLQQRLELINYLFNLYSTPYFKPFGLVDKDTPMDFLDAWNLDRK